MPGAAAQQISGSLLERDRELSQLRDLVAAAAAGHGAAVLLEGTAGIGKSSLLAAVRAFGADVGLDRLVARGGELERDFAYGVARQLLEPRLRALPNRRRTAVFEGAAALAAPVLGMRTTREAAEALGGDPTAAAMHGLYWLTANLATETPLLLTVDDLHWSDAESIRFLAFLARRVEEMPVLLVAASRPPVESQARELIEALEVDHSVARLEPAPLSPAAVVAMVQAELGDDPAEEFCAACHSVTGGNPFLVRSVLDAAIEEGLRPGAEEAARIPELGVRAVSRFTARRLERLGPGPAKLARAVAVIGTDVEPRIARALAGLEEEAARKATDALLASGVLASSRPLEFVHPLIRAAVHEGIAPAERAARHLDAARALAGAGTDAERVAPHLLATDPREDPWVVEVLRDAAARSVERGAPEAAVRYLRRALEEPPADGVRIPLLAELGRSEVRAALPDDAVAHLRLARAGTASASERARMSHDLAVGLIAPGRYVEGVEMLEEALADAVGADAELARRIEAELVCAAKLDAQTISRARALAQRLSGEIAGDTPGERMLLATLSHQRLMDGASAAEAAPMATRAVDGGLGGEQPGESGVVMDAAFTLTIAGDFARAQRLCREALDDAARRGSVIGFARMSAMRSILNFERGALADAELDARNTIEAAWSPGYRIARMAHGPLVGALVEQGSLDDAAEALARAGFDDELPDSFMLNFVLFARARLRLAQGRRTEALQDLEMLGRRELRWRDRNPAVFPRRSMAALALMTEGRREQALAAAREELELARAWGTPGAVGRSLRVLGLVEGGAKGLERLRAAVAVLEGSAWRLELAHALLEVGAATRRRGNRSEAREPLHAAMELAHTCGAAPLVGRAREELVATGVRPRRVMRSGVDALTASELRVGRMAAEGMTNREIAQALFVTTRTVEVHLTHAYQKLDISSREHLPAALNAH